jgi:hypothetical protein
MSAVLTKSSLTVFLPLIQQRLETVLGFPPERVILDARDNDDTEYKFQADQYLLLRVLAGKVTDDYEGAGRNAVVLVRDITVTLWTRLQTDEATSDYQWLTNASLGHLQAEEQLYNALAGWQPLDSNGLWVLEEPIYPRPVDRPLKSRKRVGWGRSTVQFSVMFALSAVDAAYQ